MKITWMVDSMVSPVHSLAAVAFFHALIAGGFGGEEVYGGFTVIECLGERRGFLIGETSVVVGCWVGE